MATSRLPDEDIIALLQEGNQQAVAAMVTKYGEALLGVIMKIVASKEIGEEVLQDVFVKAWKNKNRYNSNRGRLFTWLINIARNAAIDHVRLKKNQRHRQTAQLDPTVYENDRRYSEEMQIRDIGLHQALGQLDEKYRQMIDLLYLQGYSQREVTKEFDIPLGTVKTRAIAAIRELRKILGSETFLILAAIGSWIIWLLTQQN